MNIHNKIRNILTEEGFDPGFVSEEDLLRALQQRGIVDDVVKDLTLDRVVSWLPRYVLTKEFRA